jgi:hypothetical protein
LKNSKIKLAVGVSVLIVVLVITGSFAYLNFSQKPKPKPKPLKVKKVAKVVKKPKPSLVCPYNGLPTNEPVTKPLAVMVENLVNIRPQAGLGDACLVVEALTEGGITRFMLVFGHQDSSNVGPIRSARTHFVALAKGWNALYSHVGGSTFAMQAIKNWQVDDLDQGHYPQFYHRISGVRAPHNVFSATTTLKAAKQKDVNLPQAVGFKFQPETPVASRPASAQKVTINFSYPQYQSEYVYEPSTNRYLRYNGGAPHLDANTKQQLAPKNIIIVYAPTAPIAGTPLLDVNLNGSGRALILKEGTVTEGSWEKPDFASPIQFKDQNGAEVKLVPGQVWLEIVTLTTPVNISQ